MMTMAQKRRSVLRAKPVQRRRVGSSLKRCRLSQRFHQNWMAKSSPEGPSPVLDDSLTSLSWLQNLNILLPGATPSVRGPSSSVNPNTILDCAGESLESNRSVDFQTQPSKPPHSYATLICMAMKASKQRKMTLSSIYHWISDNFAYYRTSDLSWQNSIRHNLSLNKYFQKVPRMKEEPGKGCFWQINPEFASRLEGKAPSTNVLKIKKDASFPQSSEMDTNANFAVVDQSNEFKPVLGLELESSFVQQNGALKGDFSFNSLLAQDIEVDGVKVKTEELIRAESSKSNKLHTPLKREVVTPPPASPAAFEFDGMFPGDLSSVLAASPLNIQPSEAIDHVTHDPLDLSISGISIKAPDWWDSDAGLLHSPHLSPAPGLPPPSNQADDSFLQQLVRDVDFDALLDMT